MRIGYWRGDRTPDWPDVAEFVDESWDADERDRVATHLRHGIVVRSYLGLSPCRFCGEPNGSLELSDGTYIWPQGLAHNVESHGVRLPTPFVRHVLALQERFDDAIVDDTWWRHVRPVWPS